MVVSVGFSLCNELAIINQYNRGRRDSKYKAIDRFNINSQLEHLQAKYVGTGHADLHRFEWAVNIQRDSYASYVGHYPTLAHFAVAENESIGRERYNFMQVRNICECVVSGVPSWVDFYYPNTTSDYNLSRDKRTAEDPMINTPFCKLVQKIPAVNFFLVRRLVGVRTKGTESPGRVSTLARGEIVMLNIGCMSTGARVVAVRNDWARLQLTAPVCTSRGEKHWRLIGWGQIQAGITLDVPPRPFEWTTPT
ncbi:hypothetical protein Vadar_010274 [Vaccinium darrowii]|uniref:Uncharacterized protein n=1 Tax=Vaccinium darrowii TaxID=229202 RepID=A0ACB7ZJ35_9ERIC|nr:hypothetical protein Vadar_010274 [Vaccinium darrowii]